MSGKITIADVAAEAGVSTATVSYILNGRSTSLRLSEATVARVLEVCERLGYRADEAAIALSKKRSEVIHMAFLSPWLYARHSDFMAQIYAAFDALRSEYSFTLDFLPYEGGGLHRVLKPSKLKKYDVVFAAGTSFRDDEYAAAHANELDGRLVMINRRVEASGLYSICGNDFVAEARLASEIAAVGYYDRYIIINEGCDSVCRIERLSALREVFGSENEYSYSYADGTEPLTELVASCGGRACFMFTMHNSAARFLAALSRRGVALPLDCGIVGYDIHPLLADFLPLELTTVDPHVDEMVRRACACAKRIKGGERPCGVEVVEGTTVRGESVVWEL